MLFKLKYLTPKIHEKLFSDVTEFRTSFGLPINARCSGGMSSEDDELHTSLFIEEFSELVTAKDLAESADALIDACFVLVGRESQMQEYLPEVDVILDSFIAVAERNGIPFMQVWDIVHASNMSKLSQDDADFEASRDFYRKLGVPVVGEKQANGLIAIKCKENTTYVDEKGVEKSIKKGKVLKSINYKSADEDIKALFI
ncbi:nucleoside triphosphate pyrophosphohydrolase family protein [Photobacterium damselae]|uniref:nucleoside triphosphate pyrophosphohydrolase family protein n=1 Tax=Photobacterium damselae TaxID=38293 RepID=UPI001F41A85D|nr:nucleoside triphosphate pyrophosphohydrolase family protein [Photobacterium damselae]UKA05048.1 nucleoside triphosphate pyrophosphohydrolase family protein [Photobacterium damselae subsp. damselae]